MEMMEMMMMKTTVRSAPDGSDKKSLCQSDTKITHRPLIILAKEPPTGTPKIMTKTTIFMQ